MWAEALDENANGWTAGTVIGENAFDSKVGEAGDGSGNNPTAIFRDVVARGWRGPIGNAAAFNAKEDVDFVADRVLVHGSEIAFRLRAPAVIDVHNTVIHDVDVAFRFEDGLSAPRVVHATFGRDVAQAFTEAGGAVSGPDLRNLLFLGASVPGLAAGEASNLAVGEDVFVDAASDDYHLLSDAQPVDAGVQIDDVTYDYDGVARPIGDAYDVGAFEWTDMPPPGEDTGESGSEGDADAGGMDGPGDASGETTNSGSASASDGATAASSEPDATGSGGGSAGASDGSGASEAGCGCRSGAKLAWWSAFVIAGPVRRRRRAASM
jgi:hypothetical protein